MSYSRWTNSDWYTFAHIGGGLAVWSRHSEENPVYANEDVERFVSGERPMSDIPGWNQSDTEEQKKLVRIMEDYLAEEPEEHLP